MNPSDSKTLKEIEKKYQPKPYYQGEDFEITAHQNPDITWLIFKVKEQDREIKELQLGKEAAERLNRMNVKVADGETDRAEKLEKENEELKRMLSVPHN